MGTTESGEFRVQRLACEKGLNAWNRMLGNMREALKRGSKSYLVFNVREPINSEYMPIYFTF
jgi:hypothetical protein